MLNFTQSATKGHIRAKENVLLFCFAMPWYNRHGWLGVKNQLSIFCFAIASKLLIHCLLFTKSGNIPLKSLIKYAPKSQKGSYAWWYLHLWNNPTKFELNRIKTHTEKMQLSWWRFRHQCDLPKKLMSSKLVWSGKFKLNHHHHAKLERSICAWQWSLKHLWWLTGCPDR